MSQSRPRRLLTQNRELREIGVWNWTLPAWAGRLPDGRTYNTCGAAGVCAQVCYARNGTYRFSNVLRRHEANLMYVMDEPQRWQWHMSWEIKHRGVKVRWLRVHDAGDFFSDSYMTSWLQIMRANPRVRFYTYTKEIDRFKRLVVPDPPPNFEFVYSFGGRQDHLIGPADRQADVFPDEAAMAAAGFENQETSDLLAILGPPKVGIVVNNIPAFKKKQGPRSFAQWQAEDTAARRHPHPPPK